MSAPLWLLALLAIPLIRWLHRWQAPLSSATVSAAFLWNSATDLGAGGESTRKPDLAWRRRASIAALLALALAQPWWQRDTGLITVWIDDSLSMSTVEDGESRLAAGFLELDRALSGAGAVRVMLRSLSNPAESKSSDEPGAFDAAAWLNQEQALLHPPPGVLLNRGSAHWLVTDGASVEVIDWVTHAPLSRVIRVGAATENVALTRLSARRNMHTPGVADVLVAVSNLGTNEASRELVLLSGSDRIESRALAVGAGETRYLQSSHAVTDGGFTAVLSPGDRLTADDSLSLPTSVVDLIPVDLDIACPAVLSLAIQSHPALSIVAAGEAAELQVDCSDRPARAQALLRVHVSAYQPVDARANWRPGIGRLQELHLSSDWIAASEWGARLDGDYETLLAAGEMPLIVRRSVPPFAIETVLDMSRPRLAGQPEYPAMIAGLIDLALGGESLDAVVSSAAHAAASVIAPSDMVVSEPQPMPHGAYRQDLSDLLLALAILIALADLLLLWRAGREARRV